jgi:hypothetical protein
MAIDMEMDIGKKSAHKIFFSFLLPFPPSSFFPSNGRYIASFFFFPFSYYLPKVYSTWAQSSRELNSRRVSRAPPSFFAPPPGPQQRPNFLNSCAIMCVGRSCLRTSARIYAAPAMQAFKKKIPDARAYEYGVFHHIRHAL